MFIEEHADHDAQEPRDFRHVEAAHTPRRAAGNRRGLGRSRGKELLSPIRRQSNGLTVRFPRARSDARAARRCRVQPALDRVMARSHPACRMCFRPSQGPHLANETERAHVTRPKQWPKRSAHPRLRVLSGSRHEHSMPYTTWSQTSLVGHEIRRAQRIGLLLALQDLPVSIPLANGLQPSRPCHSVGTPAASSLDSALPIRQSTGLRAMVQGLPSIAGASQQAVPWRNDTGLPRQRKADAFGLKTPPRACTC